MDAFEDELKKLKDFDDVLYVNQAFNPLWSTYHSQFPSVELFFRIDDTSYLPILASKL